MFNWIYKSLGLDSVGTIVKARIEMVTGAVMAGVTALTQFSFLPYLTDTVNPKLIGILAAYTFASGVITEIVRRWNATDV